MSAPSEIEGQPAPADAIRGPYGRTGYRWYVLALLTVIYTCHAIDRGMPNILLEPIRHEFGLKDSQLGLFSGLAYALSFSLSILPMGYLSDRANRRNFLGIIVLAWSACTALGGFAQNFVQLVLARVGVGAAESGAAPVAMPMIADIFPARTRGSALGVFYLSNAVGVLVASTVGAYVAATHGWRMAFFLAGLPGILLAVLLFTTVIEPRRGAAEVDAVAGESAGPPPKLSETFLFLFRNPGLICLILGCGILGMISITMGAWAGSFFIRIHHLNLPQVGLILGFGGGGAAAVSPLLFGWLGDRLGQRDPRLTLLAVAAAALVALACGLGMLFAPSVMLAVVLLVLADTCRMGYSPPCYAVLMDKTPVRLRGATMSIMQLTTNVFGFGVGPLLVGFLSDLYGGETALRYAMANALGLLVIAALLLIGAVGLLYGWKRGTGMPTAGPRV